MTKVDNSNNNQLNPLHRTKTTKNRATKSKHQSKSTEQKNLSPNNEVKKNIHDQLQQVDLSTSTGKELGRHIFIKCALENEFGDYNLSSDSPSDFIKKVEAQLTYHNSQKELDSLIKSLQKSSSV